MTVKSKNHSERDRAIASEAARWCDSQHPDDAARRPELAAWLTQSPTHVREFVLALFIDAAMSRFDPECEIPVTQRESRSNVVPLTSRGLGENSGNTTCIARVRGRRMSFALVATLAFVAIALMYLSPRFDSQVYETAVGEQLTVALTDGSLVALNARTRLEVRLEPHQRNLRLLHGQAMFTVAHDSNRPFLVYVDGTVVRAVGTKFDVRRAGDRAVVSVMEGRVQLVEPEPAPAPSVALHTSAIATQLTPGQRITIFHDGKVTGPSNVELAAVAAWQERRLIFEEDTLAEIADQFAAYRSSPKLIIEGSVLGGRLYTGSFDATRPDTFVDYLARDPSIEMARKDDRVTMRLAQIAEH